VLARSRVAKEAGYPRKQARTLRIRFMHSHVAPSRPKQQFERIQANVRSLTVSWQWGSGQPGGEVAEVKEQGEIAIESNRGNTIKKNADPENPAVHIERPGNDVVKRASELQIDEKADTNTEAQSNGNSNSDENKENQPETKSDKPAESEKKDEDMKDASASEKKESDDSKTEDSNDKAEEKSNDSSDKVDDKAEANGKDDDASDDNKRKVDESAVAETNGDADENGEPPAKKAKTDNADAEGETDTKTKKPGRPKASEKKEKKEPAKKKQPKPAATEDGQPRRSSRNK
jgi:hypothetical protein